MQAFIRSFVLCAAVGLLAGCLDTYSNKNGIEIRTNAARAGGIMGENVYVGAIEVDGVWDNQEERRRKVGHVEVVTRPSFAREASLTLLGGALPAAISGGLGLGAASIASCDGADCGTQINTFSGSWSELDSVIDVGAEAVINGGQKKQAAPKADLIM